MIKSGSSVSTNITALFGKYHQIFYTDEVLWKSLFLCFCQQVSTINRINSFGIRLIELPNNEFHLN
jgi:hypothetical protein